MHMGSFRDEALLSVYGITYENSLCVRAQPIHTQSMLLPDSSLILFLNQLKPVEVYHNTGKNAKGSYHLQLVFSNYQNVQGAVSDQLFFSQQITFSVITSSSGKTNFSWEVHRILQSHSHSHS